VARVVGAGATDHLRVLADLIHDCSEEEIGEQAQVICGTGTNDTRHSIELTKAAAEAGAEAALVVTPYLDDRTEGDECDLKNSVAR